MQMYIAHLYGKGRRKEYTSAAPDPVRQQQRSYSLQCQRHRCAAQARRLRGNPVSGSKPVATSTSTTAIA
jgi:hypothetical protein